jgi:hypothetical protein
MYPRRYVFKLWSCCGIGLAAQTERSLALWGIGRAANKPIDPR